MTASSFFFWGVVDLPTEVNDDIQMSLVQPRRTLFYNRGYGCGITDYENAPVSIGTLTMIKYEVVRIMALRNAVVTDGNTGVDRRAAASQDTVDVVQNGPNVDVSVRYVLLSDMTRNKTVPIQIGGLK